MRDQQNVIPLDEQYLTELKQERENKDLELLTILAHHLKLTQLQSKSL